MKEYKNLSEKEPQMVCEPAVAVAYGVKTRVKTSKSTGHSLSEFSAELDRRLSEHYGVDFKKVTQQINSGNLNLDDVNDELLSRPEFQY